MAFSNKRIILIGYMASGKSTIGRILAEKLGYAYMDTDHVIEQVNKSTITQIFKEKGETYFRNEELKVAKFISQLENIVISTGGGLPIYHDNMQRLNNSGITIYIDVNVETIAHRILNDAGTRPLHTQTNKATLLKDIKTKLDQRKPVYEKAHQKINGHSSPQDLASHIMNAIHQRHPAS